MNDDGDYFLVPSGWKVRFSALSTGKMEPISTAHWRRHRMSPTVPMVSSLLWRNGNWTRAEGKSVIQPVFRHKVPQVL